MTGMFNGKYRAHIHTRRQWAAIMKKPFRTSMVSFDMPMPIEKKLKNLSIGALVKNNRAGSGNFNTFNFLISGAYNLTLTSDKNHHISTGIQVGIIQKSVDVSALYFDNQFFLKDGGGFDPSLPNNESFDNNNVLLADLNIGIIYYYSNNRSRVNPFGGISIFHLNRPRESFLGISNKLPARYVYHWGVKLTLSQSIQIIPQFLFMKQAKAQEFLMGLIGHYKFKGTDKYLTFGPSYRNSDAIIIQGGFKSGRYTYRISYDINTSSLQSYSRGRGGIEFSIIYILPKEQIKPTVKICSRL